MEIDLRLNSPDYPDIHTWTINVSEDQKEMFPFVMKTMVDMGLIRQGNLWDAYRGSDNDVVVYKVKK